MTDVHHYAQLFLLPKLVCTAVLSVSAYFIAGTTDSSHSAHLLGKWGLANFMPKAGLDNGPSNLSLLRGYYY
jgi:hypothetical protein